MENETQFDLNIALAFWRERVASSVAFTPADVRELESHLKDSIGKLQNTGLSIEESFQIATQRLGSIESLTKEYAKINSQRVWVDRALWMAVGLQAYMFASSAAQIVVTLIQTLIWKLRAYGLFIIDDGSVFSVARIVSLFPLLHWIVLVVIIGYSGRIAFRSNFELPRWLKPVMLNSWRLWGALSLTAVILSLSTLVIQRFFFIIGSSGRSPAFHSYIWNWQSYMVTTLYGLSAPMALVWILDKKQRISGGRNEVFPIVGTVGKAQ